MYLQRYNLPPKGASFSIFICPRPPRKVTKCQLSQLLPLLLKECLKVGHEELLYGNASRTDDEGMLGVELLGEDAHAAIGGAAQQYAILIHQIDFV